MVSKQVRVEQLLRVLKDLDRNEVIRRVNEIKSASDNHINHLFLVEYFKQKDVAVSQDTYRQEAEYIVDIFPQYEVEYIESMLSTLGSESNRVVVILRQLLKNEPINNLISVDATIAKPPQLQQHKTYLESQPTTSKDYSPNYKFQSFNYFDIQIPPKYGPNCNETLVSSRKRKIDDVHSSRVPPVPKIKVKALTEMCNSTISKNKKSAIPATCTTSTTSSNSTLPEALPNLPSFPSVIVPNPKANNIENKLPSSEPIDLRRDSALKIPMNNDLWEPAAEFLDWLDSASDQIKEEKNAPIFTKHLWSSDSTTIDDFEDMEGSVEDLTSSDSEGARALDPVEYQAKPGTSSVPRYQLKKLTLPDQKLVSRILEIIPDVAPAYVRELCVNRTATDAHVDAVLQIIFANEDYPKRRNRTPSPDPELDLEEQLNLLKEILPDADPNYLQYQCELYQNDKEKMLQFISQAVELKNYPTLKEYLRKQRLSAQVKQYTTEFKIEKFLELIPDPDTYFNDPKRKHSLHDKNDVFTWHYASTFLRNQFPMVSVRDINQALSRNNNNLIHTAKALSAQVASGKGLMRSRRKPAKLDDTIQNIPLLQEIAYVSHRQEIVSYINEKTAKEEEERQLTKENGLMRSCNCCYNEEVMPKDVVTCEHNCEFCGDCVKRFVEISFGEGKLDYPCLLSCGASFTLQTLQKVLPPKLFSKMAQKKQMEEVKAAGIEELETCPFCDFATIPAPGDKLFRCLNPECMKESCRTCKEPSHVPLRCDEIEKDDDVRKRTYIENKMTEALIRVCHKCGMKFIKADGCNKMTCSCGAMMCYVCGQPVKDYKHFNGQGGDQYHLCPLYSDTNKLHKEAVVKGAQQAKAEVGIDDPKKLKFDPTSDLDKHYKVSKRPDANANVALPPMEADQPVAQLHRALARVEAARMAVHHHHHHHHHGHNRYCNCHRHRNNAL